MILEVYWKYCIASFGVLAVFFGIFLLLGDWSFLKVFLGLDDSDVTAIGCFLTAVGIICIVLSFVVCTKRKND